MCVTHGSNQSSQGSQASRWDYPGKICGRPSCLMVWIPVTYTKDPTKLLRRLYQEKFWGWPERDRDMTTWKKAAGLSKFYKQKTSWSNEAAANMCYPSRKRKNHSKDGATGAEAYQVVLPGIIPRPWNLEKFALQDFELLRTLFLPFFPFWNEHLYNCYTCPTIIV